MKIGIMTQPLRKNYGGILQAYALQKTLLNLGHESVIINRVDGYPSAKLLLWRLASLLKCVFLKYVFGNGNVKFINPLSNEYITDSRKAYDYSNLDDFIANNLKISSMKRTSRAVRSYLIKESLDCIVVGSDQVWREEYSPKITDYFGGFLSSNDDVKLVAYAASFGIDSIPISNEKQSVCSELLRHFSAISVREKSAKILLRDMWNIKSDVVLDPTLLLTKSDYESLINGYENGVVQIFSYMLDETEEKKHIVNRVSNLLGQDVVQTFLYPRNELGYAGKLTSMQEWLYNISKASFVVTDSYHGCLFSIIFNKPFLIIANNKRGIGRFETILTTLKLDHRLICSLDQVCESLLYERLDYKSVNTIIKSLRQKSLSFLKNSL